MDLIFFIDLGRFYMISTIWHIDRIDLGIFGELDLVNLIGLFDFLWIRAVWVDLGGFQSIRMDLCRLGMTYRTDISLFLSNLEEFIEFV